MGAIGAGVAAEAGASRHRETATIVKDDDHGMPDWAELAASEDLAGYRWGAHNGPHDASACPTVTEEFRKGCEDWVEEQVGRGR